MHGVSRLSALAALVCLTAACGDGRPEGWTDETHGKKAKPAYDVVFPSEQVQRLDIAISAEDWQAMQDDMTDMLGAFGVGGGPGGGGPGGGGGGGPLPPELAAACQDKAEGATCSATFNGNTFTSTCGKSPDGAALVCTPRGGGGGGGGGGGPLPPELTAVCQDKAEGATCSATLNGNTFSSTCTRSPDGAALLCAPQGGAIGGGGGGGGVDLVPRTPVYVRSTVRFNGKTWWHVGVRYKGNSTLSSGWRSGVGKLPFRLNFDKFEDEHPEIDGQHFHGFSKLSLSSNQGDASYIRDHVASSTFRAAGVPAAHTGFMAVYVDHGNGPEYFGLYTVAEDPQDSLLDTHFGNHDGALYEADGVGARFKTFDQASFEAQSDAAELGWESVEAAIAALNADRGDAAAWRAGLEARMDVDGFLQWLAINTVLANWDSYGSMPHNYYLYANPENGNRLHWITWDHNLSLSAGRTSSLTHSNVTADWPLIRYLLDDPTYRARYEQFARESITGPLSAAAMQERMRQAHELIAPWVAGENAEVQGFTYTSAQQFQDSLTGTSGLLQFAEQREAAVRTTFGTAP
ncbi:CotH kinase family protein [Hyalangium gracile]|uniref:CotH kinase family protein n=1 Tax=Hyalangium gracile TaxID=394092 RepID=UPI001CCB4769|nr:CotH kinase family protein [Hyalangium gracile]